MLAGCTTIAGSEGSGDASVIVIDRDRDDAGNVISVLVHVAGLQGGGLSLTLDGAQEISVPSAGIWRVPLETPKPLVDLQVLTQPDEPAQACEVQKLDDAVFSVICHEETWEVGGEIKGLVGNGLRLALYDEPDDGDAAAHSVFIATEAGKFAFTRPLADGASYRVEIEKQPTEPRQDCTVKNSEGIAEANVADVEIECVTKTYIFTTTVVGLKGTGLEIDTEIGPIPLDPGTTVFEERFPDGYEFYGAISKQPTNPSQLCFMQNGTGKINGADVHVMVVCDAQGALRISEVGACPASGSACWFEIFNTGTQPENLAFYRLRTSALSPTAFVPSRMFTLPDTSVPAFGHVVLQANVAGALPDGNNVYHLKDNDTVPWWSSDGFVELLNPAGATATFLRWGSSTMTPSTGGTYGGGSAPALPRGPSGYGYSLQHPKTPDEGLPRGEAFKLYGFPTPGGGNDVVDNADTDSDGIPDSAEIPGGTYASLNMYAMGARIGQKDVFVEIDHMAGAEAATLPRKEALDRVVEAFRLKNIALHFDVGNLFSPIFDPSNYNLGGGNEVPFATAVGLAPSDPAIKDLYAIKATNMDANRRMVFYYQLFAWSQQKDGSGGSSGIGEMPGNDSIITLGGFGLAANSNAQKNLIANYQAASIMHELGHNFSLRHGGSDSINRKPNYVSVMNYLYSPLGLPTIGNVEGDRYDFYKRCSLNSVTQLTNSPSGDTLKFAIDYSGGGSGNLDESAVHESAGLGRTGSNAVDFNCNSKTDSAAYARDLNADGAMDVLADNNDWASLDFVFRRYATGAENGPSLVRELERFDTLSMDALHNEDDEPCPAPFVPSPDELR